MKDREKNISRKLALGMIAAVCAIAAAGFGVKAALDPYGNRIVSDVTVAGLDVGGMTRSEARKALQDTADRLAQEDMVIRLPQEELHLAPDASHGKLSVREAVKAAFAYGRDSTQEERDLGLLPFLQLDQEVIRSALQDYADQYDVEFSDWHYELEGQKPALTETNFDETAPCQTLLLTLGTPEQKLDVEAALAQVLDAYDRGCLLVEVVLPEPQTLPEAPDLKAVYREVCTEPVDASLNLQTYARLDGVYGYDFDLEEAKTLMADAEYGETVAIPLRTQAPEILGDDVYFRDVLGAYNSGHSNRPNIVNNLELVCGFLDGTVIQPGETFSYNDAVGERTVERGFLYGESFTGFLESRSAGGGVCQGSSVLYVCALTAELEIVERVNHGMEVNYTPPGQDAAVSWGGPDFRFRNNTHFPIKITAKLEDNEMKVQLLGTDEKDYYIELESTYGKDSLQSYANVYARKYDKQTKELISREKISNSAYRLT